MVKRPRLLHHRTERQTDAGRHDALHAIDFFLLHKLLEALDGVLWARLFLDHQLDLAASDAALCVEPLDSPFGGPQAADAGTGRNAGTRRQDADPTRLGLGDGGREHARRCSGGAGGGHRFQDVAA